MSVATRWIMAYVITTLLSGCSEPQTRKAEITQRPAATSVLAELGRENAAEHPQEALRYAQSLIADYPGTPEADTAKLLLPKIEVAVEAAAEAERARLAEAAKLAESRRLAEKWTYDTQSDPMTGKTGKSASLDSENTVNFSFPYEGPQNGTLTIRDHPSYGQDVLFSIREGQFLCRSYEDCQIRVRFNDGAPEAWNAVGPSDNSTTVIFLRNYSRFVRRLRAAKVVRIQVPVYQEGQPVFEFQVSGFNFNRYTGE